MLTPTRLVIDTIRYYWLTHIAIIIGVVIATSALTGALIVGDSIRGSLKQMTLDRLGDVHLAIDGPRFFRENLALDLQQNSPDQLDLAPVIHLSGAIKKTDTQTSQVSRAGKVEVYAIDDRFWKLVTSKPLSGFTNNNPSWMIINDFAAHNLNAQPGDEVSLFLDLPSSIPRDTLFGDRDQLTAQIDLPITTILPSQDSSLISASRFSLRADQFQSPIVYLPLKFLQQRLDLAAIPASRRNPIPKPARVNALYARQPIPSLASSLTLEDLQLRWSENPDRKLIALESDQMILENTITSAARNMIINQHLPSQPILLYLANELSNKNSPDNFSMYSTIAGLDLAISPPFGIFQTIDGTPAPPLNMGEIAINAWLAEDLHVTLGDVITMKYHQVGSTGQLPEKQIDLTVAAILSMEGPTLDKGLVPVIEGVTTAESFDEWEQPFPMDLDRITQRDEDYWDKYRATPKAFLSLQQAQFLWTSKYGSLTSIRLPEQPSLANLSSQLISQLDLPSTGLAVQPVRQAGLAASAGSNDFAGLFMGFSFFLIAAAVILTVLLFRLAIEQRVRQLGLYQAVGLSPFAVQFLLLREAAALAFIGSLLGIAAAIGYAWLMMTGLATWWQGAVGTSNLHLHIQPLSLLNGLVITLLITIVSVWWSIRSLSKISIRQQLSGNSQLTLDQPRTPTSRSWSLILGVTMIGISASLLIASLLQLLPQQEAFSGFNWNVVAFFLIGFFTLLGAIFIFNSLLSRHLQLKQTTTPHLQGWRLSLLNASRRPSRTLTTLTMIASATFLIVAVAVGQYNPLAIKPEKSSGNGGFSLVAESSRPILQDVTTLEDQQALQACQPDNSTSLPWEIYQFPVKQGENASCLNLYQTTLPTILGVPDRFIQRGGFAFANTPGENPWTILTDESNSPSIPAIGDMNTLMYSLHKPLGSTVDVPNAALPGASLKISGMLTGSLFQGLLLISESNFRRLFPNVIGNQYFLIQTPDHDDCQQLASTLLETRYEEFGFDAEPVADRLARFLAVQNTYLSTFQTLGGLGLLLGTFGLAIVMLRNVLERESEIALLRAIGFVPRAIASMVFMENALILIFGVTLGTASALLAMLPHITSAASSVPWTSLLSLLTLVLIIGNAGVLVAMHRASNTPIIATLRRE